VKTSVCHNRSLRLIRLLTPTFTSKGSDSKPPTVTRANILVWNSLNSQRINLGGQPASAWTQHRRSRLTILNAFVRSIKARYKFSFCSLHFSWSNLLRISCLLCWDTGRTTCSRRRASMMCAIILPATKAVRFLCSHSRRTMERWAMGTGSEGAGSERKGPSVTRTWGTLQRGPYDPPKIWVGWATMHLSPPIIGLYVR